MVEMLRRIKVAKDVAVKARTASMITLKAVLVNDSPELREVLQPLSKMTLIDRCAGLRPSCGTSWPVSSATPRAAGSRGGEELLGRAGEGFLPLASPAWALTR